MFCSSGCPVTHPVDQTGFELRGLPACLPSKCWAYTTKCKSLKRLDLTLFSYNSNNNNNNKYPSRVWNQLQVSRVYVQPPSPLPLLVPTVSQVSMISYFRYLMLWFRPERSLAAQTLQVSSAACNTVRCWRLGVQCMKSGLGGVSLKRV